MFNRSQIMIRAWKLYRSIYSAAFFGRFSRNGFRQALREAWRLAKIAAVPAAQKAARIEAIEHEIEMLSYKSFRIDTTTIRRQLKDELRALAA